jgi:hypothetical protein
MVMLARLETDANTHPTTQLSTKSANGWFKLSIENKAIVKMSALLALD